MKNLHVKLLAIAVEISLLTASERPVLQGGPLQGRYLLDSAHFHWLPNDDATGGTHVINNVRCDQSHRLAGAGGGAHSHHSFLHYVGLQQICLISRVHLKSEYAANCRL